MKHMMNILLMVIIAVSLTGCGNQEYGNESNIIQSEQLNKYEKVLVGRWAREGRETVDFEFMEDGDCISNNTEAKWAVTQNGYLRVNFFSRRDESAYIEIVDNDTLIFKNPDDKNQYYTLRRLD